MKRYIIIISLHLTSVLSVLAQESMGHNFIQDSVFRDPYLKALVQEALDNNSDVRIAALNIEQAEAVMKSAKLTYLPTFALTPSGTLSKVQGASTTKSYSLPLFMEWEFSLNGRQKGEKQMAQANWMRTQEQLRYQQVQLIANVCNAYYTLIMLDHQYTLTGQSIDNQESTLETIRTFREVGRMDELAVNQADAALHETEASLVDLDLQRKKVETSLSLLLNRPTDSISIQRSAWGEAMTISINPASPIGLHELSSRPDVRSAEYELVAVCGNVRVAKAAFYPTLRISADCGWTNNVGEIVNPGKLLLNMIGSLTQPLFARGTIKAQKKVAESQLRQTEVNFEKALLIAGSEVKDALEECIAAQKKKDSRKYQVESSKKAWQNSLDLLRYSQSVTYLDILTAKASYLSAQLLESADWLEHQQALINLYKALCPLPIKTE